jgi:hypothetical protein
MTQSKTITHDVTITATLRASRRRTAALTGALGKPDLVLPDTWSTAASIRSRGILTTRHKNRGDGTAVA